MILNCTLHGIGHEFQEVCLKYGHTNLRAPCSKTLLVVTGHFQKGKLLKKELLLMMDLNHIESKKQPTKVSDPPTDFNIRNTLDEAQVQKAPIVF